MNHFLLVSLLILIAGTATTFVMANLQPKLADFDVVRRQQQRQLSSGVSKTLLIGGRVKPDDAQLQQKQEQEQQRVASSANEAGAGAGGGDSPSTSNAAAVNATTTTTTTTTPWPTYGPSQHRVTEATYEAIVDSYSFFVGVRRVVFENCFNEYFFQCRPALTNGLNRVTYQWMMAQQNCLPYWCNCLGGAVYDNDTACMAPMSYPSYSALCTALETCYPAKEHCANQFIYTEGMLPSGCGAFTNCSLQAAQKTAAYKACVAEAEDPTTAASKCSADKICQQMKDPLAPVKKGPGVDAASGHIPQALRDIWMATAAIFGIVILVACVGVVLLRRRHRQWEQMMMEAQNMATERADEVVWFEPGTSAVRDADELATAIAISKRAEEAAANSNSNSSNENGTTAPPDTSSSSASASASAAAEAKFDPSTCVRCGAPGAHLQLLPCRCRWCGCGSGVSVTIPGSEPGTTTHSPRTRESAAPPAASASPSSLYGAAPAAAAAAADGMVEASALSCKGLPVYTCKITQAQAAAQLADDDDSSANNNNSGAAADSMNGPTSAGRRNNSINGGGGDDDDAEGSDAAGNTKKCARPKCERCHRIVNFVIDYTTLFFPAASQDESVASSSSSENGAAAAREQQRLLHRDDDEKKTSVSLSTIKNNSPSTTPGRGAPAASAATPGALSRKESEGEDLASPLILSNETAAAGDDDDDEDGRGKVDGPDAASAAPGPRLTAEALAPAAAAESKKEKRRRKVIPSCCICLSEPSSVAIISCGHVAQCVDCAKKLCVPVQRADAARRRYVISAKCPLCREDITAMVSLSEQETRRAFDKSSSAAE